MVDHDNLLPALLRLERAANNGRSAGPLGFRYDFHPEPNELVRWRRQVITDATVRQQVGACLTTIRQWDKRIEGAENSILENLKRLESASMSKTQRNKLSRNIDKEIVSLESQILASRYDFAMESMKKVESLRRRPNKLIDRAPARQDPLESVPYQKRLAFQEIFELIHECALNRVVANQLVDRITRNLSAKYDSSK